MAQYDAEADRYDIDGVMGPDEYHDGYPDTPGSGLRNNAYTNVLASWVLRHTAGLVRELDDRDDPSPSGWTSTTTSWTTGTRCRSGFGSTSTTAG
ncbi:hypothetical protein [Nesterenkonia pannonica]|uniref:hypothetical protein n=1 Tax=Nesterenkonia pannonica TaxID=1548602 RepID=UPI002164C003|nr:hypothetical protein [Nesterenkonia pannonica]